MKIRIEPTDLAVNLLRIVAVLLAINCLVLFVYFYYDGHSLFGLGDYFDFGIEHNIPTMYSALAILLASALLALIARASDKQEGYWIALSFIFLFLALDEATAIHESIGDYFENYIEATGLIYFMWVVPYGVAVLVIGLAFLRFVLSLPKQTRNRFILAGVIFITGAMGIEMPGAAVAEEYGTDTVLYSVLYTFEELFEMLGIVLFNFALLSYLTGQHGEVVIALNVDSEDADQSTGPAPD
jgi:hypothetical protein